MVYMTAVKAMGGIKPLLQSKQSEKRTEDKILSLLIFNVGFGRNTNEGKRE